jgi:hypothetical protein
LGAFLVPLVMVALPVCARAHVIPNDAKIVAFLKPEGPRLRFIVRVPLEAMVDLSYPTRGSSDLLDLDRADAVLRELAALWISNNIQAYEDGRPLPRPEVVEVRASLAFDGSFASYDQALRHVTGPRLTNSVDFVWNQGLLDVLLESPIESAGSRFSVRSTLSHLALRTTTTLRSLAPGGTRTFEFMGDPGLIVLDPAREQTATRFARLGFFEILGGADYWLFLFVLGMPLGGWRALVPVAMAFTLAEAVTLNPYSRFAPDALWFQPLVGLLIAIAVVYMAVENGLGIGAARRWMIAFGFGLVLGFRFSLVIRDSLQFAGSHALTSLVSFAAAADVAQLLVLVVLIPAQWVVFRFATERGGRIVMSLLAGDVGWHAARARGELLSQYQFQGPAVTTSLALTVVTWLTNVVIAAAVFWMLFIVIRRYAPGRPAGHPETGTSIQ